MYVLVRDLGRASVSTHTEGAQTRVGGETRLQARSLNTVFAYDGTRRARYLPREADVAVAAIDMKVSARDR